MNKMDLIVKIAKDTGITKAQAGKAVSAIMDGITHSLKTGGSVTLVGFGTFKVVERKARKGINPKTRKAIQIKASQVPRFVPGKNLKETVNAR